MLGSADPRYAGTASGVNNAIARTGGLLAVAVIPVAAGLGGTDYTDPADFNAGFHTAMLISAGLLALGALLSAVLLRLPRRARAPEQIPAGTLHPVRRATGPQFYPQDARPHPARPGS